MKAVYIVLLASFIFLSPCFAGETEYDIHASDSLWDKIKLKTSPKKYWQEKVENLVWNIKFSQGQIKDFTLEHKKFLLTKDIELAQAANFAQSIGENPDQARRETEEELREELQLLQDWIKEEREILKCDQVLLKKARKELKNYQ